MGKKHPLDGFSLNIKSVKCFSKNGSGKFLFAPISFVIGKNNVGKSAVLDVLQTMSRKADAKNVFQDIERFGEHPLVEVTSIPYQNLLKSQFPTNTSSAQVTNNSRQSLWDFAQRFIAKELTWGFGRNLEPVVVGESLDKEDNRLHVTERLNRVIHNPLQNTWSIRIHAERDIQKEGESNAKNFDGSGHGLTNLIRAFINSDNLPRSLVEEDLLNDLNEIYLGDCEFTKILCQHNEASNQWEIYLREEEKGDIKLSQSGSSLKTAFIILSFLRLYPYIHKDYDMKNLIFCLEEPENNLHPALLRRLIEFLDKSREEQGFSLVITTHSPICIDWASRSDDSTIIHVQKDCDDTICKNVIDYVGQKSILEDLDVRGSDILQSNGIIWVEGPSDRIYIKKWIELVSNGHLVEGAHYNFLYYGGKILSHFEALPTNEVNQKIKMLLINRNVAIIMDSDRNPNPSPSPKGKIRKPRLNINDTKKRLIEEVKKINGYSWVTEGKEIENYVPAKKWDELAGQKLNITNDYVDIPSITKLKDNYKTKVALAHAIEPCINEESIEILDLSDRISELCEHIKTWNNIKD